MKKCPSVHIILDELGYKKKEENLKAAVKRQCENGSATFHYTSYESRLIRFLFGLKYVGNFLYHLAYWGQSFAYALELWAKIKRGSTVVCFNPIVGYFLALLSFQKKWRLKLLGFLFEPKENSLYYILRKAFVKLLASGISEFIVYSQAEVKYYGRLFPCCAGKFRTLVYGRDFDLWETKPYVSPVVGYVASGGASNRDYLTLCRAYESVRTEATLCIAARPENITFEYDKSKISVRYDIRLDRFGSFLDQSMFVVLPLMDYGVSAGHMVLLHAMQLGKIIVVASIPSIQEYVTEDEVLFYRPRDVEELKNTLQRIITTPEKYTSLAKNAQRRYLERFRFESLLIRTLEQNRNQ